MTRSAEVVRHLFVIPIVLYRKIISPFTPSSCIYTPSCSAYAQAAVLRHGVLRGTMLAIARLARCVGAFYIGGDDAVPQSATFRSVADAYRKYLRRRGGPSEPYSEIQELRGRPAEDTMGADEGKPSR